MPAPATDPTRQKLLDAAGEVFVEQGFQAATVREICTRAGANVAAVNYYFGDKTGLYVAVLADATCASEADELVGAGLCPKEKLRLIIRGMFRRMTAGERPSWAFRLMAHEMTQPTPALTQVIHQVIQPRYERLRITLGLILRLPPDHETTRMCAHSIIGQVIHYVNARPVIAELWPELKMTPEQVEKLADHVAEFSICSVLEIAKRTR